MVKGEREEEAEAPWDSQNQPEPEEEGLEAERLKRAGGPTEVGPPKGFEESRRFRGGGKDRGSSKGDRMGKDKG